MWQVPAPRSISFSTLLLLLLLLLLLFFQKYIFGVSRRSCGGVIFSILDSKSRGLRGVRLPALDGPSCFVFKQEILLSKWILSTRFLNEYRQFSSRHSALDSGSSGPQGVRVVVLPGSSVLFLGKKAYCFCASPFFFCFCFFRLLA